METKTIRQEEHFQVNPAKLYDAFMDAETHSEITGDEAQIDAKVGGAFSAFGGYCFGKNVTLEPSKKIVQTWIAPGEHWPEDHISEITLIFHEAPAGTRLEFIHEHVPEKAAESIANGWCDFYWEPMREYFDALN